MPLKFEIESDEGFPVGAWTASGETKKRSFESTRTLYDVDDLVRWAYEAGKHDGALGVLGELLKNNTRSLL